MTDDPGFENMAVGRVRAFIAFTYGIVNYECALLEWFETVGDSADPVTGMWVVKHEMADNQHSMSLVSIDTIVRSAHLLPVFGADNIPYDFDFTQSLDAFEQYYVNHFVDGHAFELLNI